MNQDWGSVCILHKDKLETEKLIHYSSRGNRYLLCIGYDIKPVRELMWTANTLAKALYIQWRACFKLYSTKLSDSSFSVVFLFSPWKWFVSSHRVRSLSWNAWSQVTALYLTVWLSIMLDVYLRLPSAPSARGQQHIIQHTLHTFHFEEI